MDRLDAMMLFVAAVDDGSLAAAARRHGRSAAAATRAVTLLEQDAGETLLLRSTRRLRLTAAGERHLAVWRDILSRLHDLRPDAADGPLHGRITVTAPELFGRIVVMPIVETFLRDHPPVTARVLMLNRVVDLVGEGFDLAVRLMHLPDSSMTAIRLGEMRALVCATPGYLASAGTPATPADLANHDCIGLNADGDGELWPFRQGDGGGIRSIRVRSRISLNNAAAALDSALRGHGLVKARAYQVADHIRDGRLVSILDAFEPQPTPVQMVFHPDLGRQAVVRAFVDHATPLLRAEVARVSASVDRAR